MMLGCLATIANMRPANLTIIIWDNGIYQITGKQATATSGPTDIVALARGAGFARSEWVSDAAHFDALIARGFTAGGPALLAVKIDDQPGQGRPARDPPLLRRRFMRGLGANGE
jgi:thiamine pyrophosphate-dependent acetolactate synthase large subunit-like protein